MKKQAVRKFKDDDSNDLFVIEGSASVYLYSYTRRRGKIVKNHVLINSSIVFPIVERVGTTKLRYKRRFSRNIA